MDLNIFYQMGCPLHQIFNNSHGTCHEVDFVQLNVIFKFFFNAVCSYGQSVCISEATRSLEQLREGGDRSVSMVKKIHLT